MSKRDEAIKQEAENAEKKYDNDDRLWYLKDLKDFGLKNWTSKEGENYIRILPPLDDTIYFGYKIFVHYNIGVNNNAFLCPEKHKVGKCPICEKREALRREDDEKNKDIIYGLYPTQRVLFQVVDTKSKDTVAQGIQLFDAAKSVNKEIVGLSVKKRTGETIDISDPSLNLDIAFVRKGLKKNDTEYSSFSIEDGQFEIPVEVFGQIVDFNKLVLFHSYNEMKSEFDGYDAKPAQTEQPAKQEGERQQRRLETKTEEPPKTETKPPAASEPTQPAKSRLDEIREAIRKKREAEANATK